MIHMKQMFRTKPIDISLKEAKGTDKKALSRTMGALDLTALGVGAIIGTGIFVLTGVASAKYAGPAVVLSFLLSAVAAGLSALCYAELAAMVPVAGSAYAYTFSSLGEIVAWLIGWNLILEYLVSAGAVAIGWSSYLTDFLKSVSLILPDNITKSPMEGGVINIPAIFITLLITWISVQGVRDSARATKIVVVVKIAVIILFIVLGISRINPTNWRPFLPFGFSGITHGAAIIFFAYIGFDAVSTAAEEVKDPSRDLPRGIIWSLIISTILYIFVALILTGMVKYTHLNTPSPISAALLSVGIKWAVTFISIGALAGLTSVLLAVIYAQSRIFFAMARDGLLPPLFAKLHKRYKTPYLDTLMIGIAISAIAGFLPVGVIAQMANIGTLSALFVVSLGVIILRKTKPDFKRPFRVPWVPFLPVLSMVFILYLMVNLPPITWIRFLVWIILGVIVYTFYGFRHSILAHPTENRHPEILDNLVPSNAQKPKPDNPPTKK